MTWEETTDRIQRAVLSRFSQAVTYAPTDGTPVEITAVFDVNSPGVSLGGDIEIIARGPRLSVRDADLAAPPLAGDAVEIKGVSYFVRSVEEDGKGWSVLELRPASA